MLLINNETVKPKELIEKYSIPMPDMAKRPFAFIEQVPTNVKWDKDNQMFLHPKYHDQASYSAVDSTSGETFELRYCTRPPQKQNRNGTEIIIYTPRKMHFEAESIMIDLEMNLEQYVWWYLHPRNQDSPFYQRGTEAWFQGGKSAEKAAKTNEKDVWLMRSLNILYSADRDFEELKIRMKGLKQRGYDFGVNIDNLENDEIVLQLSNKAKENPEKFFTDFQGQTAKWEGSLVECIDKGYLQQKNLNGFKRWHWNAGARRGEEICVITGDRDPYLALREKVMDNMEYFYTEILHVLSEEKNKVEIESVVDKVEKEFKQDKAEEPKKKAVATDSVESAIVRQAVDAKIIVQNKMNNNKTWNWANRDGNPGKLICVAQPSQTPEERMNLHVVDRTKGPEFIKALQNKLETVS